MPETKEFALKLTKDEMHILKYAMAILEVDRDPLKDTYEMGDDEPEEPYTALNDVTKKIYAMRWDSK